MIRRLKMLPFARMVKYGNRAPTPNISKILTPTTSNYSAIIILYDNGELWGIGGGGSGGGSNYIFGDGDVSTNRTTWTLIRSNVKNAWCSVGRFILLQTKTDEFLSCSTTTYAFGGVSSFSNVYVDRTSYFSSVFTEEQLNNIKDIHVWMDNIIVHFNDGSVYGMGRNANGTLGTGNTTAVTQFTLISTDVKKICIAADTGTWILKNNNTLFRCGINNYGQLGTGNTTALTTFTEYTKALYTVSDIMVSYYGTYMVLRNTTTSVDEMWVCGNRIAGNLGNGVSASGNVVNPTLIAFDMGTDYKLYPVYSEGYFGIGIKKSDGLYGTGGNYTTRLGSNPNPTLTFSLIPNSLTDSDDFISMSYNLTAIVRNNGVMYTGINPSSDALTGSFVTLQTPK